MIPDDGKKERSTPRRIRVPVRRIVRWAIVAGLVLLALLGAGRWLVHSSAPKRVDAVFVLSGHRDRVRAAAGVFREAGAGRVVLFVEQGGALERTALERILTRRGVPPGAIRVLGPVGDSEDEAQLGAGFVERCGLGSVAVVTSPYHTRRAGFLWRRAVGGRAEVFPVSDGEAYHAGLWFIHLDDMKRTALEWAKLVWESRFLVLELDARSSKVPC
jgi:uncharacterized SAM-binding protein YcdF (DUF218 family)